MTLKHNRMNTSPRLLFLIDGLGALLSAALLGLVLPRFEALFNMPPATLHILALIACVFAVYSLSCFICLSKGWGPAWGPATYPLWYLKAIAVANLLYGALSLGVLVYLYPQPSIWSLLYFASEVTVIGVLALIELRVASKG